MMYTDIVVPLDGSDFAEAALPHAKLLAKAFNARVTLLYVVERLGMIPPPGAIGPITNIETDHEKELDNVRNYLDGIISPLRDEGIDIIRFIREGDPVTEICEFADENDADIIVMSTHGRSGFQRFVFGSVADGVLKKASIPILLIRAQADQD